MFYAVIQRKNKLNHRQEKAKTKKKILAAAMIDELVPRVDRRGSTEAFSRKGRENLQAQGSKALQRGPMVSISGGGVRKLGGLSEIQIS